MYSRCSTTRRGSITNPGNTHARKALIEAAWHYRRLPRVSRDIPLCQEGVHQSVDTIARQAQLRLYQRHKTLRARGTFSQKAAVAVARELAAFVLSNGRQVQTLA